MESSRTELWVLALALALGVGCAVGQGDGEFSGSLTADDCGGGIDEPDYRLRPTFFTGELVDRQLAIRIQRGSDLVGFADGLHLIVLDVNEVRNNRIGLPIPVSASSDSLVQVVFYLNETCEAGFPSEFRTRSLVMEASSGSVTFDSIYAPDIDAGATGVVGRLTGLVFEDPQTPDTRRAMMDGWFSFFYQRGQPAQRFP